MGLKPDELYRTPLYDLNRMAEAFEENRKDSWHMLRVHAWLVSIYGGLDSKGRKKLTPEKMLSINDYKDVPDPEEIQKWTKFFNRKVIKTTVYN